MALVLHSEASGTAALFSVYRRPGWSENKNQGGGRFPHLGAEVVVRDEVQTVFISNVSRTVSVPRNIAHDAVLKEFIISGSSYTITV